MEIVKDSTDVIQYVVIKDSVSFVAETGFDVTTLDFQYTRNGSAPSAKQDVTALVATDSDHADNKAIEIGATNSPGLCRVDFPDAAFATGVDSVILSVIGAGFDPIHKEIQLVEEPGSEVWDRLLTGSNHNIATSAGRRLRELASTVVYTGTARGAGTNNNQIQLDVGASAVDGSYDPTMVAIIGGTGAGQARLILEYDGTEKMATVDRDWKVSPESDSEFAIYAHPGREHVNEGLVQDADTNTITLNALASSLNDAYKRQLVFIRSGTGQDQVRVITAYNGTSKIATVEEAWGTVPDTTSAYVVLAESCLLESETASASALAVVDANVDDILADTVLMDKWIKNKMEFNGTSMILYDDDGTTPLLTFTLSSGTITVAGPYNRAKAT